MFGFITPDTIVCANICQSVLVSFTCSLENYKNKNRVSIKTRKCSNKNDDISPNSVQNIFKIIKIKHFFLLLFFFCK